jgi:hypothetical protein
LNGANDAMDEEYDSDVNHIFNMIENEPTFKGIRLGNGRYRKSRWR